MSLLLRAVLPLCLGVGLGSLALWRHDPRNAAAERARSAAAAAWATHDDLDIDPADDTAAHGARRHRHHHRKPHASADYLKHLQGQYRRPDIAAREERAPMVTHGLPFPEGVQHGDFQAFAPLLIHRDDILPPDIHAAITAEAENLKASTIKMGDGRRNLMVPKYDALSRLVAEHLAPRCIAAIKEETGLDVSFMSSFPVEMRVYDAGVGMFWHRDLLLYTHRQFEMVYTVANAGGGVTEYIDRDGRHVEVITRGNSAMLLRAEGVRHRVQPMPSERVIIKAVFSTSPQPAQGLLSYMQSYDFRAWASDARRHEAAMEDAHGGHGVKAVLAETRTKSTGGDGDGDGDREGDRLEN